MGESTLVATNLNEFNTTVNQLSYVEIDFDDEVCALIRLAYLLNSWEPMRAIVSSFVSNAKLKFNDVETELLLRRFVELIWVKC